VGQIAWLELAAVPDQHIAQPSRLDFRAERIRRDAERPARFALGDQQPAGGQFVQPLHDVGVKGG
jgi:hypothetical protein